jgi:hypothetical protein
LCLIGGILYFSGETEALKFYILSVFVFIWFHFVAMQWQRIDKIAKVLDECGLIRERHDRIRYNIMTPNVFYELDKGGGLVNAILPFRQPAILRAYELSFDLKFGEISEYLRLNDAEVASLSQWKIIPCRVAQQAWIGGFERLVVTFRHKDYGVEFDREFRMYKNRSPRIAIWEEKIGEGIVVLRHEEETIRLFVARGRFGSASMVSDDPKTENILLEIYTNRYGVSQYRIVGKEQNPSDEYGLPATRYESIEATKGVAWSLLCYPDFRRRTIGRVEEISIRSGTDVREYVISFSLNNFQRSSQRKVSPTDLSIAKGDHVRISFDEFGRIDQIEPDATLPKLSEEEQLAMAGKLVRPPGHPAARP